MPQRDRTTMGGVNEAFLSTQWTQLLTPRDDDDGRRALLDDLIQKYWKPIYCCLRRKGHDNETAKDLVQGFFLEIVFGRDLVAHADRTRGRFRTFLLTALDRYVTDVHRFQTARKRMPAGGLEALDTADAENAFAATDGATPDAAFEYAWAESLIGQALRDLEADYVEGGKSAHWRLFQARVVRPILDGTPPPSLPEIMAPLGIEDEQQASNMIATAKRRFQSILRRQVRQSVDSDDEVDAEIADLMRVLSGGRARS
jgi:DNA-directed RNA polymerase specialized sigma24 family protein